MRDPAPAPVGSSTSNDTDVPVIKGAPDPRVNSRLAAFCRRYSVDELPQLLQVASGKMRLVGPRPLTPRELEVYYGADCAEVLSVRPGLTGLWQVMGPESSDLRAAAETGSILRAQMRHRTVPANPAPDAGPRFQRPRRLVTPLPLACAFSV